MIKTQQNGVHRLLKATNAFIEHQYRRFLYRSFYLKTF